jgi:L,D-transpeptidase ErfK/SrfK
MRNLNFITTIFFCAGILLPASAKAATYAIDGDVAGKNQNYTVKKSDNLYAIARKFNIGIVELLAANPGVNIWKPKAGTELTIASSHILPETREGIVLNLSELRLFYFPDAGHVMTFPIGIGRAGWETPKGATEVLWKREHPDWKPPASIRAEDPTLPEIVPAGKNNPLGDYAITLGLPNLAIHGTNKPYSVGKRSSHGCIRLYPEDISQLFKQVNTGTPVTIVDNPYKLGWQGNRLFLEIFPTQQQGDIITKAKILKPSDMPELHAYIISKAGEAAIDWIAVNDAILAKSGIPTVIATRN